MGTRRWNAPLPTLGGRQFWADELFFHDWHIQRNVFTGHYRLLDGAHVRHAWGTLRECQDQLADITRARRLPPMRGPGVVVLHGLFRSASSMQGMSRYLRQTGGYSVFNVNYPTTRGSIAEHAASLARIIERLDGIDELFFVCHSLGNLVVRHYLGDHTQADRGIRPDARIKRMVMLGPPNQGARLAEALGQRRLFQWVAGAAAAELGPRWPTVQMRLPAPEFPFGILAGGRGAARGYNPWLAGDNDFVVSVESTRLAGAADFAILPVVHTWMMDDRQVQAYTLRFLQHGFFVSDSARNPIPGQCAPV